MTPKTTNTTMNPPFSADSMSERGPADLTAQWQEARLVYPIYAALATQFDLAPLPYAAGELPPEKPSREAFDGDLKWLTALDEKVLAYQIRQLPSQVLNGSEQALRALIHRQLRKVDKTNADRDKIDLLLVMTVNPGFGGQSFIHECLPKVQQAEAWRRDKKLSYRIEVDGGINNETAAECARAGADTFVAGTSLFGARSLKTAVKKMRKIVCDNDPALADLSVPTAAAPTLPL